MKSCPCCGAVQNFDVMIDAEFKFVRTSAGAVTLGDVQFDILSSLLACFPRPAYISWLRDIIGVAPGCPDPDQLVRQRVRRLRAALKPTGIGIGAKTGCAAPKCYWLLLPPREPQVTHVPSLVVPFEKRRAAR